MSRLPRRWAKSTAALLIWCGAGARAFACPICFQVEDAAVAGGVRAAVLVLMAVTGVVLVGFAAFAVRLARAEKPRE